MKLNALTSMAAALLLTSYGLAASATDLGILNAVPSVSVVANLAPGITFADKYFFSLATDSSVTAAATDLHLALHDLTVLGIDEFKLNLFDSAEVLIATAPSIGQDHSVAIDDTDLTDHSYYFQVSGVTVGTSGGYYAFSAQATPFIPTGNIPEPQSWALLALGLGFIGVNHARRHRTS
jgi:hypothetical protein